MLGCFVVPYCCDCAPRRLKFVIAFIGFTAANLLLGPSKYLEIETGKSNWNLIIILRFVSFALIGIFSVFVFIPVIPEIIERI